MSESVSEYIVTGKIGVAYGIKGWVKIHSYTEYTAQILQYNPWYIAEGDGWTAFKVEAGREHGKGIVAKLAGIETPEIASKLAGKEIAIQRLQLAELLPDQYYWADLEGLMVIDQHEETLGQIAYMLATGSNDVLVIKTQEGKEHAIPYLPGTVVKKIDLKQRVMYVDWDLI